MRLSIWKDQANPADAMSETMQGGPVTPPIEGVRLGPSELQISHEQSPCVSLPWPLSTATGDLWLIALLVLAVSTDRFGIVAGGINFRLELIAGGLISLVALSGLRMRARQGIGLVEWCLLGWLAANAVSSLLFSPARGESLKFTIVVAGALSLYAAAFLLLRSVKAIEWAAFVWVAAGTVVAALGVLSALAYTTLGFTGGVNLERVQNNGIFTVIPRVMSVMWEPNVFGAYAFSVAVLAFWLSLAPSFQQPRLQGWLGFAVAGAFSGMVVSMTRTVWLIGLAAVLPFIATALKLRLATPRRLLAVFVLPALIGAAVGLAVGNAMPVISWRTDYPWDLTYQQLEQIIGQNIRGEAKPPAVFATPTAAPGQTPRPIGTPPSGPQLGTPVPSSKSSTLANRFDDANNLSKTLSLLKREQIYRNALQGWLRSPLLGWGAGAYPYLYPPAPGDGYWIANLELHTLFDTGVVGLLLLTIAGAVAFWRGVRALLIPPARWATLHFLLLGLLFGGLGLLLAYQNTEGTWLGFTWVYFAMLVATGRRAASVVPIPATPSARAPRSALQSQSR